MNFACLTCSPFKSQTEVFHYAIEFQIMITMVRGGVKRICIFFPVETLVRNFIVLLRYTCQQCSNWWMQFFKFSFNTAADLSGFAGVNKVRHVSCVWVAKKGRPTEAPGHCGVNPGKSLSRTDNILKVKLSLGNVTDSSTQFH